MRSPMRIILVTAAALVVVALLSCAFWSVPIGLDVVFHNDSLIRKPF